MKSKLTPLQLIGALAVLTGAGLVLTQLYFMTVVETSSSEVQQQNAEVEPLVISPTQFGPALPAKQLALGEVFAKLYVPRFGSDYVRNIAEGTDLEQVLDQVGIGRYIGTQFPGEKGNFAIAGHRTGAGGPMRDIEKFQPGDLVFVETAEQWFTYIYLESKIVPPSAIDTIAPVPEGLTNQVANGKYLTMTSCEPIYINTERIVAWFALVAEQPASYGMPKELLETYQK